MLLTIFVTEVVMFTKLDQHAALLKHVNTSSWLLVGKLTSELMPIVKYLRGHVEQIKIDQRLIMVANFEH